MASVNEVNAYNRGKREGYDIGVANTIERAKREGLTLRWWKLVIAGLVGFTLALALEAHAETVQTTLTVLEPTQVTAEVPCTPINCPETLTANSTAQTVENESLLSRWWSAILEMLR